MSLCPCCYVVMSRVNQALAWSDQLNNTSIKKYFYFNPKKLFVLILLHVITFMGLFRASWMSNLLRMIVASNFLSNASRSMYAWDSGTRSRTFYKENNQVSEQFIGQNYSEVKVNESVKILFTTWHSLSEVGSYLPFSSVWKNKNKNNLNW